MYCQVETQQEETSITCSIHKSEWEVFSVGQPAASPVVVHSVLWFISLLKSHSRLINWCGLTCCWLAIICSSYSDSVVRLLALSPRSLFTLSIMSVCHSLSWCTVLPEYITKRKLISKLCKISGDIVMMKLAYKKGTIPILSRAQQWSWIVKYA